MEALNNKRTHESWTGLEGQSLLSAGVVLTKENKQMYWETRLARQETYDGFPMQKGHRQEEGEVVKEEFGNLIQVCRTDATKAQLVLMHSSGAKGHKKSFFHFQ